MKVGFHFLAKRQICRYCGGKLYIGPAYSWRVRGDNGRPCPESVAAGYPAHCPEPWGKP